MTLIGQDNAKGVRIRHAEVADAEAMHALVTQPDCFPFTTLVPYSSMSGLANRLEDLPNGEFHLLAEKDTEQGVQMVGSLLISVPPSPRRKHTAMFGITINQDFHGQGYGSILMQCLVDFCTKWLAVTRIELDTHVDNPAAVALYQKFGFVIEATSRKAIFRDGEYVDSYKMALVIERKRGVNNDEARMTESRAESLPTPQKINLDDTVIRHSEVADAAQVQALYAQKSCYANTLQLPYPSLKSWQDKLAKMENSLVIEYQGKIIGQAGVMMNMARPRKRHVAAIGMGVDEHYRGQGVGSKLLSAVLDLAINWMAATRVELEVYADNEAGIALYKKHGFEIEGKSTAFAFRDGKFVDVYHMAKLV